MYVGTYLERDAYLYPTRLVRTRAPRALERSQVIPNVPPPKPLVYDDVFEGRERDKMVRGGEGREERVSAVGFELDPEGGKDEEGFWRNVWVVWVGGTGEGERTVENLGEPRPDETCEHDPDDENGTPCYLHHE